MASSLIEWARAGGAKWSASLEVRSDGSRGRGVFATAPIQKGDLLLRLPMSMAVRPCGRLKDMVAKGSCSPLLALALTVVHELNVRSPQTSVYFADLASAPPPDIPALWEAEELEHIVGTNLLPSTKTPAEAIDASRTTFEEDVLPIMETVGEEYLPKAVRTQALFGAALAWVTSRALQGRLSFEQGAASLWPYLKADGPSTSLNGGNGMFLLPLFDLLNHSSESKDRCTTLARVDGDGKADGHAADALEMRAERSVAANEEILHSYGCHGAAELLRTYGFVETSPYTSTLLTVEQVVAAASVFLCSQGGKALKEQAVTDRLNALRKAGRLPIGDLFQLATTISTSLLTLIQVLIYNKTELKAWVEHGSPQLAADTLISEIEVVGILLQVAEQARAAICRDSQDSCGAAGGKSVISASGRSAVAKTLRDEQQRVIREFKKAVIMLAMGQDGGDEEDEDDDEEEEEEGGDDDDDEEEEDEDENDEMQDAKRRKL